MKFTEGKKENSVDQEGYETLDFKKLSHKQGDIFFLSVSTKLVLKAKHIDRVALRVVLLQCNL